MGASCTLRYLPTSAVSPVSWRPLDVGWAWGRAQRQLVLCADRWRPRSQTDYFCSCPVSDHPERVYLLPVGAAGVWKMAVSSPPRTFLFLPYGSLGLRVLSPWPQVSLVSFVPASVIGF